MLLLPYAAATHKQPYHALHVGQRTLALAIRLFPGKNAPWHRRLDSGLIWPFSRAVHGHVSLWLDAIGRDRKLVHHGNPFESGVFLGSRRFVLDMPARLPLRALPPHLSIYSGLSPMNVQIFGRRDCSDSRKAERWFKERKIPFQFIDLKEKGFSPRELESVAGPIGYVNLVDKDSKRYKEKGLAFMSPSRIPKVLAEDSLLIKTPVVRNGSQATLGFCPDSWKLWV